MEQSTFKTLKQIWDTRESVVVKRDMVDPLIEAGLVGGLDEAFFLTEKGGEVLEEEEHRRAHPGQDEFHSPGDDH